MDLPLSAFPGMTVSDASNGAGVLSSVIGSGGNGNDLASLIKSILQKNDGKLDPALVQLLQNATVAGESGKASPFDSVLDQIMSKASPALLTDLKASVTGETSTLPVIAAPVKEGEDLWAEMERALAALLTQPVTAQNQPVLPLNLDGTSNVPQPVKSEVCADTTQEVVQAGATSTARAFKPITPFETPKIAPQLAPQDTQNAKPAEETPLFDLLNENTDPKEVEKALAPNDPKTPPPPSPVQVVSVKVEAPKAAPRVKAPDAVKASGEVRTDKISVAPQTVTATATTTAAPTTAATDVAPDTVPEASPLEAADAALANFQYAKSVVYEVLTQSFQAPAPVTGRSEVNAAPALSVGAQSQVAATQTTPETLIADQVSHLQAELKMTPPQHLTRPAFSLDQAEHEAAPLTSVPASTPTDATQTELPVTATANDGQAQLDSHTDENQQTFEFARPTNVKSSSARDAYSPVSYGELNGTPVRTIEARRVPYGNDATTNTPVLKAERGPTVQINVNGKDMQQVLPADSSKAEKISEAPVTITISAPAPHIDSSNVNATENKSDSPRLPVTQLADSVRDAHAQGKTSMEIILKPEGLGTLKIKMIQMPNETSGTPNYRLEITAHSAEAHSLLNTHMQELSKALGNWQIGLEQSGQPAVRTPAQASSGSEQNFSNPDEQARRSPQHQERSSSGREKTDEKFSLNLESD